MLNYQEERSELLLKVESLEDKIKSMRRQPSIVEEKMNEKLQTKEAILAAIEEKIWKTEVSLKEEM